MRQHYHIMSEFKELLEQLTDLQVFYFQCAYIVLTISN